MLMCPACARPVEGCRSDGCGPAGVVAPVPVEVADDAAERAAAGPQSEAEYVEFVRRRSVLPPPVPAWGTSSADVRHAGGVCDPVSCRRCQSVAQMRPASTEGDG